jgi:hypothetical protein
MLSDLLSVLTASKKADVLGHCSICGCSVFYKTLVEEESCSDNPKKWENYEN